MSDVASIMAEASRHAGTLVNNNQSVRSLRTALMGGQRAEELVPMLLGDVIDEAAWRDRMDVDGECYTFGPDEFTLFIESDAPKGLGVKKDDIRKYLGDSANPLRRTFETLAERGPGNPSWGDQFKAEDGRFHRIPNDIRDSVATVPFPSSDSPTPSKPKRDRSREPKAGTSIGYAIRKLERESARDPAVAAVYDRLKAGEISAHGAMVLAGFVEKSITIPADPIAAGRRLARHFTPDQVEELVRAFRYTYAMLTRSEPTE